MCGQGLELNSIFRQIEPENYRPKRTVVQASTTGITNGPPTIIVILDFPPSEQSSLGCRIIEISETIPASLLVGMQLGVCRGAASSTGNFSAG